MLEMQYMDPSFDISNLPTFNNIDGLIDISEYLDFAIKTTIRKQLPNITEEQEKKYAAIILNNYIAGSPAVFTSQYNIRQNIKKIGVNRIKGLLLKTLIEKYEYNNRVSHKLVPDSIEDEYVDNITDFAYRGQLEVKEEWINRKMPTFISIYINEVYKKEYAIKRQKEEICYQNDKTEKALQQLNLQMSLNQMKQRV